MNFENHGVAGAIFVAASGDDVFRDLPATRCQSNVKTGGGGSF